MKNVLIIVGIIIAVGAIMLFYVDAPETETGSAETSQTANNTALMQNDIQDNQTIEVESVTTLEEMSTDETDVVPETNMRVAGSYELYTPEKVMRENTQTVLFFKASWCPSCRVLDADIQESLSDIPEDVTILEVDYDTNTELRKQYGVTTQHTLVVVDSEGNQLQKWSGGSTLESILTQLNP